MLHDFDVGCTERTIGKLARRHCEERFKAFGLLRISIHREELFVQPYGSAYGAG
jgi:hypothetical protein